MNSKQEKYFAESNEIELKQWGALADVSQPDDLDIIWMSIAMSLLRHSTRQSNRKAHNRLCRLSTYDRMRTWEQLHDEAYSEFFASPMNLKEPVSRIEEEPQITHYAVNNRSDGPNAVISGVFVDKEIDEAFELWSEWSKIYEPSWESAKVIDSIRDEWHLINIVHNDSQDQELESVKTNDSIPVAEAHDDHLPATTTSITATTRTKPTATATQSTLNTTFKLPRFSSPSDDYALIQAQDDLDELDNNNYKFILGPL
ncbi:hypothetical protein EC957_005084 [Mortierella hygrophila]|uniref:Uncharacterized protein n=1 Tax=Mortierella hygrophila TaxID=979708 RepID=A0A9P6F1Q9_9FUNG|nr:hypothetical protein EC957_005084 [Mortierella hygrophila]